MSSDASPAASVIPVRSPSALPPMLLRFPSRRDEEPRRQIAGDPEAAGECQRTKTVRTDRDVDACSS